MRNLLSLFSVIIFSFLLTLGMFSDVYGSEGMKNDQYRDALIYAHRKGILMSSYIAGFEPGRSVTKAELAKSLKKLKGVSVRIRGDGNKSLEVSEAAKIIVEAYRFSIERNDIWFVPYIEALAERRALPPTINAFHDLITRGELAEILFRLEYEMTFKPSGDYKIGDEVTVIESKRPRAHINEGVREILKKRACTQLDFRMGIIVIGNYDEKNPDEFMKLVQILKERFGESFLFASYGLSTMDMSEDIVILNLHRKMILSDNRLNAELIAQEFYQDHADEYDFLTIFKTFETAEGGDSHIVVKNESDGRGQSKFNSGNYGNTQRLRGINIVTYLDKINLDEDSIIRGQNLLLHETNHSWCCFLDQDYSGFNTKKKDSGRLEISLMGHLYPGLYSPYIGGGPLRSQHWFPNDDGTYSSLELHSSLLKRFHPFTLYLMGLMPGEGYDLSLPVFRAGKELGQTATTAYQYGEFSIDDIIELQGDLSCN